MSSSVTDPSAASNATATTKPVSKASPSGKGKEKVAQEDTSMDDEDDEEEEEYEEVTDEEEEEEEDLGAIDPSAILPRRTRGARVDYTSEEALAKAGIAKGDDDDEAEDSFVAGDADMKDD
ncbi:hypothetical protein PUNSTDRAFT_50420 [Punctularia strigosozonata HHB-11173 SS5]|uniref:uncharacterized protein n=1 Tax=Punctularia strigosozonata (strain HHB-11173) TaxID=741275 RepID=UPI0004416627|nr:uncharacterized protein PUNSTDRAFT_50420 [Punctularia strigosozonata HHB-11173 SS5]EIN11421.1 hypothetical protein PUNSTDRAFT_50420 [Punctularia strigosozonata HHB-11173 SS5]